MPLASEILPAYSMATATSLFPQNPKLAKHFNVGVLSIIFSSDIYLNYIMLIPEEASVNMD